MWPNGNYYDLSVNISVTNLSPDQRMGCHRNGLVRLTKLTSHLAARSVADTHAVVRPRQMATKKRRLNNTLRDIRQRVARLSRQYDTLTTFSEDVAGAGIQLSDKMSELIDDIVSNKVTGDGLRCRLTRAII